MAEGIPANYIAEFVGTFVLVFTIGVNVLGGDGGQWAGVSIAFVLIALVYALASSSGSNFNPAVSVALGIAGKMPWPEVVVYCSVQICGGIAAANCYSNFFDKTFPVGPANDHTILQACVAELIYTFVLVFVVLNTAASKAHAGKNQFYGLAIGLTIIAGANSIGSVSGCSLNPAVTIGAGWHTGADLGVLCKYILAELLGGAIAAIIFGFCRPEENTEGRSETVPIGNRCLCEFLGTFVLVLTVGGNVLSGSVCAVLSIASALTAMIFALGSASGAHFNPAVTLAIVVSGRGCCSVEDGVAYMISQIIGGLCAGSTYKMMMAVPETGKCAIGQSCSVLGQYCSSGSGMCCEGVLEKVWAGDNHCSVDATHTGHFALGPGNGYPIADAVVAELVFTFVLALVVLNVATVRQPLSEYFGLAIGGCIIAGGLCIGKVSGGALNPAVSMGIGLVDTFYGGTTDRTIIFQYCAAEFAAGLLAAVVFMVTRPSEYEEVRNRKSLNAPEEISWAETKRMPAQPAQPNYGSVDDFISPDGFVDHDDGDDSNTSFEHSPNVDRRPSV